MLQNIEPCRRNDLLGSQGFETFHRRKDKEIQFLIYRIYCIESINTRSPVGN